ncbi:hypothetical protein FOB64_006719 [Candida albicans]|nr:hypothetical protein FOB64_006719 [Candida albicans]
MTLPSILKSILLRSNLPVFSELSRVAVDLDFDLNMKELSRFLVDFLNFIDNDSVADIWNHIMVFFKDVLTHVGAFDEILSDCLLICSGLSKKLASIKNRDHKYQKELGDIFVRLFNQVLNLKQFLVSDMSKNNTKTTRKGDLVSSKPDLENNFSTLCQIIPVFEDILPDSDKVSSLANLTVTNFIIARTKSKTVSEIPEDVVVIINILGESNSCRSWKTLVSDLFMDKSFFNNTSSMSSVWRSVINSWMVHDKERFGEIISRITVTSGASPSNLFVWNEIPRKNKSTNFLSFRTVRSSPLRQPPIERKHGISLDEESIIQSNKSNSISDLPAISNAPSSPPASIRFRNTMRPTRSIEDIPKKESNTTADLNQQFSKHSKDHNFREFGFLGQNIVHSKVSDDVDTYSHSVLEKVNSTLEELHNYDGNWRANSIDNNENSEPTETDPVSVAKKFTENIDLKRQEVLDNSTPIKPLSREGIAQSQIKSGLLQSTWWSSAKWSKLRKIVKSKSISREEAINSTLLMSELECTNKMELRKRYDFLEKYINRNPNRTTTRGKGRVTKTR